MSNNNKVSAYLKSLSDKELKGLIKSGIFEDLKLPELLAKINLELKSRGKEQVQLTCEVCGVKYIGDKPEYCCNGRECGCMGLPIDPIVCSDKCYYDLINKYKNQSNHDNQTTN